MRARLCGVVVALVVPSLTGARVALASELSPSAPAMAALKVATSDGKGLIALDGNVVGEGTFAGQLAAGAHTLRVTRDGYEAFEESLQLSKERTLSRTITLKLSQRIETAAVEKETRPLDGIYGGFNLMMSLLPGGMGHSMQSACERKPAELASCTGDVGSTGFGASGFVGYHWDPVGVELYGGLHYDHAAPSLDWVSSSTDPGIGPDPARTEAYALYRVGGFGTLRIRLTAQWERVRLGLAGGVGLAYRSVILTRDTTLAANGSIREGFSPNPEGYLSPIVSLEPSVQYRISPRVSLAAGVSVLIESPRAFDQTPTTAQEGGHRLGASGLTTPAYELATGTQFYVGPFVGMMFGP